MSLPDYMVRSWERDKAAKAGQELADYYCCRTSFDGWDAELLALGGVAETLAETDEGASYEYDIYSIVSTGDTWWLTTTSGCSCPDPGETWSVDEKRSREEMVACILSREAAERADEDKYRTPYINLAKQLRESGHLPAEEQI